MTTIISQCYWRKHYQEMGKCKAFEDERIPNEVFFNVHDHKQPFPGDNGIQFEPEKEGEVPILQSPSDPWPPSQ